MTQRLDWETLEKASHLDQKVQVRGFLYSGEGGWVLSDQAGLKSCCVGKVGHALHVEGRVTDRKGQAVTLEGKLEEGRLVDAHEVSTGDWGALPWLVLGIPLLYLLRRALPLP